MVIPLLIIGILFILLATLAYPLGLDNNAAWGASRYFLFSIGTFFIAAYAALQLLRRLHLYDQLFSAIRRLIRKAASPFAVLAHPMHSMMRSTAISAALAFLVLFAASAYAFWFTSQGYFPTFPNSFNPYVALGDAFLHGQVALIEQPDPRLAAIKDPIHDVTAREKVPYHLDLSYYNGKYYAYWGPIPGLFNAVIQAATGEKPPGALAPLIFYTCYSITLAIILFVFRRWFFPRAPGISIVFYLMTGLVNLPYVFMLSRNSVYETAIIAGQCFLLIGLAGWLAYLVTHKQNWLILAGTGYALAIGSRYNLTLSVGVFLIFAIYEFRREGFFILTGLRRFAMLLAPLALMAISLAFYNYARFGNPLQTGLQYQLADPNFHHQYYSARFILPNLYGYLFSPATLQSTFPFIITNEIQVGSFPSWAQAVPANEFEQAMMGGMLWSPIFWMLAVFIPLLIIPFQHNRTAAPETAPGLRTSAAKGFFCMITIAGIIEVVHILFYYYGAMRFTADFYALFLIALVLLSWELDNRLAQSPFPFAGMLRTSLWLFVVILASSTVLISFLTGFEIPPQVFRLANPDLYNQVARIFNHLASEVTRFLDSPTILSAILRKIIVLLLNGSSK